MHEEGTQTLLVKLRADIESEIEEQKAQLKHDYTDSKRIIGKQGIWIDFEKEV